MTKLQAQFAARAQRDKDHGERERAWIYGERGRESEGCGAIKRSFNQRPENGMNQAAITEDLEKSLLKKSWRKSTDIFQRKFFYSCPAKFAFDWSLTNGQNGSKSERPITLQEQKGKRDSRIAQGLNLFKVDIRASERERKSLTAFKL